MHCREVGSGRLWVGSHHVMHSAGSKAVPRVAYMQANAIRLARLIVPFLTPHMEGGLREVPFVWEGKTELGIKCLTGKWRASCLLEQSLWLVSGTKGFPFSQHKPLGLVSFRNGILNS